MVGILDPKAIDDLLASQRFARLGCHADGKTYVVPISYAFVQGRLIGQTTPGLKISMMRKNPEVCVEVDDIRTLTDWRSVILWGKYEELSGMEAIEAMGHLLDRFGPIFEDSKSHDRLGRNITPDRLDDKPAPNVVYVIHITEKTGRYEQADA
jgi:nitroimidazol reductase NimA-like FMN-containing flavoprotein (pyridoxamine 5'-phosphate oxidase superfamily)